MTCLLWIREIEPTKVTEYTIESVSHRLTAVGSLFLRMKVITEIGAKRVIRLNTILDVNMIFLPRDLLAQAAGQEMSKMFVLMTQIIGTRGLWTEILEGSNASDSGLLQWMIFHLMTIHRCLSERLTSAGLENVDHPPHCGTKNIGIMEVPQNVAKAQELGLPLQTTQTTRVQHHLQTHIAEQVL